MVPAAYCGGESWGTTSSSNESLALPSNVAFGPSANSLFRKLSSDEQSDPVSSCFEMALFRIDPFTTDSFLFLSCASNLKDDALVVRLIVLATTPNTTHHRYLN